MLLIAGAFLAGIAAPAGAHPLGNFTSNTFAKIRVQPEHLTVDYVLDLAEIPALQTIQREDADGDGTLAGREAEAFAERRCAELAAGAKVLVNQTAARLDVQAATVTLPPGQAGLVTLRLACVLRTEALDLGGATVRFADENLPDRVGWREVIAVADGRSVQSQDVAATSVSDELRAYPQAQLASPLDQTTAALVVGGTDAAAAAGDGPQTDAAAAGLIERVTTAFTDAVASRDLTPAFALLAALIAVFLGALHALAPGHGKTVMAAYLVGRQGTGREALMLGVTVAITHTAGVLILGLVVSASQSLAPERLYPVLGAASGVLFAVVGLTLLRQAWRGRRHGHHHGHTHDHGHAHPHAGTGPGRRGVGWRALVLPGLAGGLVPTPSALVVLLGGIAIGRAWFGVALVLAYGIGMAATLVGAGYLLLRARTSIQRQSAGRWARLGALTATLPLVTGVLITVGGVVIAARSVVAA